MGGRKTVAETSRNRLKTQDCLHLHALAGPGVGIAETRPIAQVPAFATAAEPFLGTYIVIHWFYASPCRRAGPAPSAAIAVINGREPFCLTEALGLARVQSAGIVGPIWRQFLVKSDNRGRPWRSRTCYRSRCGCLLSASTRVRTSGRFRLRRPTNEP